MLFLYLSDINILCISRIFQALGHNKKILIYISYNNLLYYNNDFIDFAIYVGCQKRFETS